VPVAEPAESVAQRLLELPVHGWAQVGTAAPRSATSFDSRRTRASSRAGVVFTSVDIPMPSGLLDVKSRLPAATKDLLASAVRLPPAGSDQLPGRTVTMTVTGRIPQRVLATVAASVQARLFAVEHLPRAGSVDTFR
jgi:hypothetical protein